jgi:GNAT superfamily N-acetyltransferase
MPEVSDVVRDFAENLGAYTVRPDDPIMHRDLDGRFLIFFGPGSHPLFTSVFRFRMAGLDVAAVVEEIRAVVRERGRTGSTWEVGASATPAGVVDRLLELGLEPYPEEPDVSAMVLDHPPEGAGGADVEVRRVETLEDFRTAMRIAAEAFGVSRDDLDDDAALQKELDDRAARGMQFLAVVDGVPVGQGTGFATDIGVALAGGSVLPAARGRGAYRALVLARWEEAVRLGTPVLATNAGKMSRPILERLGFREVSRIHVLLDVEPPAEQPAGRD